MPGSSRRIESPLSGSATGATNRGVVAPHSGSGRSVSSRPSDSRGGFYAPPFTYYDIAIDAGPEAYSAALSWMTTLIATTKVRFREVGAAEWIELEETDLDPMVLTHD